MSLVKAEKTDKNLYTLEFSVDKEAFEAAIENAYRRRVKKINIPGFRPGRASRSIIEKIYGKTYFYDDAINEVLPDAYEAAVGEAGIEVVSRPEIEVLSTDDGVLFSAKVYVKPEVSIEEYKGIEVERHVHKATDEEVDAEISIIQRRNSREISITDRPAESGDTVYIDFEGFCDGTAFEGGKAENRPLTLGSNTFIPGFEDQVIGHSIGDEFEVNVTFPEDYHTKELAGKPAVFKCKLRSITKTELPALDDEFAKDVSEFDTFAEYRNDVMAKIQKRHEAEADRGVDNALSEALINKLVADIPEPMFEAEVDGSVRDYENRLRMQGLSLDLYLKYTGQTLEDMRSKLRPSAEAQVKLRLALEKIAELEGLDVSENEINAEYERLQKTYDTEPEKIRELVSAEVVKKDLMLQKAMKFVRDNAIIRETECHCDDKDETETQNENTPEETQYETKPESEEKSE
ncbi:MAG: trigger factor [Clostridiales bacterium]|nr:trigger factor [Clostridiales bacterium]HOA84490.1 trigger factor [Bacillota bacterium]